MNLWRLENNESFWHSLEILWSSACCTNRWGLFLIMRSTHEFMMGKYISLPVHVGLSGGLHKGLCLSVRIIYVSSPTWILPQAFPKHFYISKQRERPPLRVLSNTVLYIGTHRSLTIKGGIISQTLIGRKWLMNDQSQWYFHLLKNPIVAGLIERNNKSLKGAREFKHRRYYV